VTRRLRPALEILSDIGSLGFDLQHHDDATIKRDFEYLKQVNPEMFAWLARVMVGQPERVTEESAS
jgi:hypothetical protein